MRVSFISKGFNSGEIVVFKIFNSSGNLIKTKLGMEWGNTGVYYMDFPAPWMGDFLIIAEETQGNWKAGRQLSFKWGSLI